jgi:hypothetical protein
VKGTHKGPLRDVLAKNMRRLRAARGLSQEALGALSRSGDFARRSCGLGKRWRVSVAHFSRFKAAFVEFRAPVSGREFSISVF